METPGSEPPTREPDARAGNGLDAQHGDLGDLASRVDAARRAIDPAKLLKNPWIRTGLAIAVGFAAGYARDSALVRAGVRLALTSGARYLVHDARDRV